MKNSIFKEYNRGIFDKQKRLKKKINKISKTKENKRDFLALFKKPNCEVLSEEERYNYLLNITKKYFEIKEKIKQENDLF